LNFKAVWQTEKDIIDIFKDINIPGKLRGWLFKAERG
jgi:hypothetical protein